MTNVVARTLGLEIIEQLAGGEFGAFLVETSGGTRAVLKVLPRWESFVIDRVREALELVDRLRERGHLVPSYLDVGTVHDEVYTIQTFMPGAVPRRVTEPIARQLLDLWHLHEDAASTASEDYAPAQIAYTLRGEELLSRTDNPQARKVLERSLEIAHSADLSFFRTKDIVHGDFHSGNLLVSGERITTVFDWEGARVGDSRADLMRLLAGAAAANVIDPAADALLRKELERITPPEVWLLTGAQLAVFHLEFAILVKPDEMDWVLREAEILLHPPGNPA